MNAVIGWKEKLIYRTIFTLKLSPIRKSVGSVSNMEIDNDGEYQDGQEIQGGDWE